MSSDNAMTFQQALEAVEALSEEQQEDFIDVLRRRWSERRREALAQSVVQAREELARGEVRRGDVEDLMREIAG
jgi:hypothetical protein